ncbi:hypothetical protein SGQ83_03700 [Flavobacterium sp. Fl-318]|uniref:YopX protein domain-containing protein n=1 Tax=Flavobacterium cupriresistens TaxID=2893885 RepID=A0ABU4R9B8_9FLAO|nr:MULTISPECIES: hypothetical protein [unclassified Flavobacterium]MDX6188443.1 hypothetical protein [Flavobacterium sp. Fl-318]UFH44886.1 hypothetical protein LNP23_11950 [Flavobacterium sp. F-323]
MKLKLPNRNRIDFQDIQWGDWDHDGSRKVLVGGKLFSGFVVYDRFDTGDIMNEIEYKKGSHVGWENEYNISGQLVYSCLTVGETSLEIYKYDNSGNLLDHWKTVGEIYYQEMVAKYGLE